jgi:transposase
VLDRTWVAALVFMARTSTPRPLGACCRPRSGLWLGHHLLAAAGWVGPRRRVRPAAGGPVGRARCGRSDRPGAGQRRLLQPAGRQRGDLTGANPVDRGKAGSKLHVAGDAGGLPISLILSAANANDATMFAAVLDDILPIRMPSGRRRRRPGKVHADKAYDHRRCRAYLRRRGIRPRIARRMIESSTTLGRHRWTIERTGAWLGGWRRLRIRYERDSGRFYALAMLACSVICFNALQQPPW